MSSTADSYAEPLLAIHTHRWTTLLFRGGAKGKHWLLLEECSHNLTGCFAVRLHFNGDVVFPCPETKADADVARDQLAHLDRIRELEAEVTKWRATYGVQ